MRNVGQSNEYIKKRKLSYLQILSQKNENYCDFN